MTGEQIAARLEAVEGQSEKILTEVSALKTAFDEAIAGGLTPEVQARIAASFANIEAAQALTDEINPDAETPAEPEA